MLWLRQAARFVLRLASADGVRTGRPCVLVFTAMACIIFWLKPRSGLFCERPSRQVRTLFARYLILETPSGASAAVTKKERCRVFGFGCPGNLLGGTAQRVSRAELQHAGEIFRARKGYEPKRT